MVPPPLIPLLAVPSCAPGANSDFLILLTPLKRVRCSELGGRRSLKLAPLHWGLCDSLRNKENWKWSFGCLKCMSWIRAGRELSEVERQLSPSRTSLIFPSITQQALTRSRDQNQQVCHQTYVLTLQVFSAHLTKSSLHLADISYGTEK